MSRALLALTLAACGHDTLHVTDQSQQLIEYINDLRATQDLQPIETAVELCDVAATHVEDLYTFARTDECTLHSWSDADGAWTSCECYEHDHEQAKCMWEKPRELTDYDGMGFEIAAFVDRGMSAAVALRLFDRSSAHRDVLLNRGVWRSYQWSAIGAAVDRRYAVVWFGQLPGRPGRCQ